MFKTVKDGRILVDYSYAYNILMQVIPYLDIADLVACAQVCEIWRSIIKQAPVWSTYELMSCGSHLSSIIKGLEEFLKKLEVNGHISDHKSEDFLRVLYGAKSVVQLSLDNIQLQLPHQLEPEWDNLKWLKIVQNKWDKAVMNNLNIYFISTYAENLSTLNIDTTCCLFLDDLNHMKQLKHLFVDANYSKGFFESKHTFLQKLESFGVGYSNYKYNNAIKSLYNQKLETLLTKCLKDLRTFKLSYLENDFLILASVSKHPNLEKLELVLMNAWNHYSFFLAMCTNIKKLSITLTWPQERFSSICEIAAQNSILLGTVKKLKNTLKEFTCIFEEGYMTESEYEIAIENDGWRSNYTLIWENVFNFDPCNMSYQDIKNMFKDIDYSDLSLDELKAVISQELSDVRVDVLTDKYRRRCQFCPEECGDSISMRLLKILRIDRQRLRWVQARMRRDDPLRGDAN